MQSTARLGLFALAVCLAGAVDVFANHPTRVRVDVQLQVSVRTEQVPQPSYPWWAYFPYDPHLAAPPTASRYPHWPASFPAANSIATPPSNMVWQPGAPVPAQPTSYQRAPSAGFSFDR